MMENEDPFLVIGRLNYYSAKETGLDKKTFYNIISSKNEIANSLKKYNKKGLKIGIGWRASNAHFI